MLIERALRRAHYETVCERRGDTGLRRALEGHFQVIIVDGPLPGINGLEVVRALRAQNFPTPVIFFSGSDSDFEREAIAAGADWFLAKPCGLDAIVDAVVKAAGSRSACTVGLPAAVQ
jgi:DNA-binding response OmpR family regulator